MSWSGTQECQRKIENFLSQGRMGLVRLRELLPLLFDIHGIFTTESQMRVLRACSLQPVQLTTPFHQVTFAPHPAESGAQEEELSVSSQQPAGPTGRERPRPA